MRSLESPAEERHLGSRKLRTRHGERSRNDLGGLLRVARRKQRGQQRRHEEGTATKVSEVGRTITGLCGWDEYSYTEPGDPLKRFGRRETLDSSVSMGATHQCTQGASPDDEPGAGEYGCSLVECWVAEIGRTHLDRGS